MTNESYIQNFRSKTRKSSVFDVIGFGHFALVGLVEGIGVQHDHTESQNIRMVYGIWLIR